jgi:dTDP-4-dehydrorhamnose 3,5-epimerase-like enzyme
MVEVISVPKIAEDERGATHYFDTDRSGQFVVGYRKAGTHNAKHYHKGEAKNKNPEIIIILQGEVTIHWFDVRNTEIKGTCKAIAPAMVTVQAWAWHEVIADTDIIVLELNALADGKEDTYRI